MVDVYAFHLTKKTIKKQMTLKEFSELKRTTGYIYLAYEVDFNPTIL